MSNRYAYRVNKVAAILRCHSHVVLFCDFSNASNVSSPWRGNFFISEKTVEVGHFFQQRKKFKSATMSTSNRSCIDLKLCCTALAL